MGGWENFAKNGGGARNGREGGFVIGVKGIL